MKIKKLFLIALGLFTFGIQLRAQEEKDPIEIQMDTAMEENGSTAGMVDAITEAQAKWESKLNATYKSLKKKMSADEFAALQQAQRAWIAYRDLQIKSYEATYAKMDGTMWIPIHAGAVMHLTKQRAQELRNILGLLDERTE